MRVVGVVGVAVCLWSLRVFAGLLIIGLLDLDYLSVTAMVARCIAWTPCALWIDRHEYKNAPSIISFQMWLGLCGSGILISLLLPYRVTVDDLAVAGLVREAFLALAGIGVPTTVIPLSIRLRSQLRRTFNSARQTGGADSD